MFAGLGPGPRESARPRLLLCPPRTDPAPQGLSPVPCPQTAVPFWQKSLHMWVSNPSCLQLFLVLPVGAVSLHLHENKTQSTRSRWEEGRWRLAPETSPPLPSSLSTFLILPDPPERPGTCPGAPLSLFRGVAQSPTVQLRGRLLRLCEMELWSGHASRLLEGSRTEPGCSGPVSNPAPALSLEVRNLLLKHNVRVLSLPGC